MPPKSVEQLQAEWEARPTETCRCGRAVRLLNPASQTMKCVDCGYVPDLCRCAPLEGSERP